ncbi:unnamed protein product [Nyctereutes procyonoides]|uniref:(raccoon dog) hypothetical protein n=1 Tax=Nyctereutes procyonoides TaxID=34880 RepID=A0A811ZUI9_NYCPR|nr:unnamed protein product [Nyctereutes procyonoides]
MFLPWWLQTCYPCCCCPCCGGGKWAKKRGLGTGGSGLDPPPSLCVPPGSLQEDTQYELRVQESVTVQEGLCADVPCSFSYPWSWWSSPGIPYMYWFRDRDNIYNSQPARTSDQGVYQFRVERENVRYTYRDKKPTLKVAALTQKPDTHFLEPLKSGFPQKLTCSLPGFCKGGRPLTFSWVGGALDRLDPQTLSSLVLTLTLRLQDHGSNLTCGVSLPGAQSTVERTIRLNVSYPFPTQPRNPSQPQRSHSGGHLSQVLGYSFVSPAS